MAREISRQIIERIIKTSTHEGFTVLDPFMGSGTTGEACQNLNRNFIGFEFDKKYFKSNGNSNGFEKLFDENIIDYLKVKYQHENISFNLITGQHFPDMDIIIDRNKYGVELKSSQQGEWSIPGNSTLESQTDDDYNMIYLIFGSRTTDDYKYEILYDEYWRVASQIKVTHSPRFIIDMKAQQTVFKDNDDYEEFRCKDKRNKSKFLRAPLKTSQKTYKMR